MNECSANPVTSKTEIQDGVAIEFDDVDSGGSPPFELWSSTSLTLRWLPRCDNWNNPSLLATSSPDTDINAPLGAQKSNLPTWFWRVTVQFGAWVFWAIQRADSEGAIITEEERRGLRTIEAYLRELDPTGDPWAEVKRIASLGKPRLPGGDIRKSLVNLARFGFVPRWVGWEKHAQIDDDEREKRETEGMVRAEREAGEFSRPLAQPPDAAAGPQGERLRDRGLGRLLGPLPVVGGSATPRPALGMNQRETPNLFV